MQYALIFDCFGVLYTGAKSHILSLSPPEHRARLDELFRQADYGYISSDELYMQSAELLAMSSRDFFSRLQQQFIKNEQLCEEVKRLRTAHKTALLSNVNDSLIQQLFSEGERRELFDEIILSSSIGMTKPNPEIFSYAAATLGVPPEACIMIDDLEENIFGAAQAGMQGVVYETYDQCVTALRKKGVYA